MTSRILGRKQCFTDKNNCKHIFNDKTELVWKKNQTNLAANASGKTKLLLLQPNQQSDDYYSFTSVCRWNRMCAATQDQIPLSFINKLKLMPIKWRWIIIKHSKNLAWIRVGISIAWNRRKLDWRKRRLNRLKNSQFQSNWKLFDCKQYFCFKQIKWR